MIVVVVASQMAARPLGPVITNYEFTNKQTNKQGGAKSDDGSSESLNG